MGTLFVDKLDPQSGTSLELGSSGDTVSVNTGATTNLAGNVTLGANGKTITVPSGCTITNSGTANGFGDDNAPSFRAYMNSTQAISNTTNTVLSFNNDSGTTGGINAYDTNNAFDTSTHRFTPQTAGYYYAWLYCGLQDLGDGKMYSINLMKNGSSDGNKFSQFQLPIGALNNVYGHTTGVVYLNGSSDYIQAVMYHNNGSSRNTADTYNVGFGAYRLAGV
jgi:hypothetical protein